MESNPQQRRRLSFPTKKQRVRYNTKEGYDLIVAKLEPTNCRLRVDLEEYLRLNPMCSSKIQSTCTHNDCLVDGELQLSNFIAQGCLQACFCNGRVTSRSKAYYDRLVTRLEDTNCRLRVDYDEFFKLKSTTRVPSTCIHPECLVDGELHVNNFMNNGSVQSCLCNGHLRWSSDAGKARLDSLIAAHPRFKWTNTETRHHNINGVWARLHLTCIVCNVDVAPVLHTLVSIGAVGCDCSDVPWASDRGKTALDTIVSASRFDWKNWATRHDCIENRVSRIDLVCTVCKEYVNPTITSFYSHTPGCICRNSVEVTTLHFVRAVVETLFPERKIEVVHHHRDPAIRGLGNRPIEFDIVIFERTDNRRIPLLFIEVDGPHHFNTEFRYGKTARTSAEYHTFEHDVLREYHALNKGASMVRLECRTVSNDKAGWKAWLQGKIEATVRRELPRHIYRLSARDHYVSGEYAARRKGTRIDPELPSGEPFVTTGVPVDGSPSCV